MSQLYHVIHFQIQSINKYPLTKQRTSTSKIFLQHNANWEDKGILHVDPFVYHYINISDIGTCSERNEWQDHTNQRNVSFNKDDPSHCT